MPQKVKRIISFKIFVTLCALAGGTVFTHSLVAQGPELQQQMAEVQQKLDLVERAVAKNKQALTQYAWIEQDTISVNGEVKMREHFRVRMGPNGRHQKTPLDQPPVNASNQGTPKQKQEYKDYADQISALIGQYLPLYHDALEYVYQQNYVQVSHEEGAPGQYQLVISNYFKQGDKVALVFDKVRKNLVSATIYSYLNDPSDVVNVDVEFSQIPGGPNHISNLTINGARKQLSIAVQNSNYKKDLSMRH